MGTGQGSVSMEQLALLLAVLALVITEIILRKRNKNA